MTSPHIVGAVLLALAGVAQATIVNPNNPLGDNFTNPAAVGLTGQAVGASGWYYNNVRDNGIVGIDGDYARSGNGSVSFNLSGTGASKADIEYFASASANANGNYGATSALGQLNDLTSLSYEWFRDSASGAASHLHPVIRLNLANGLGGFGYLVFERTYNALATPTDTWVSDDVFAGDYRMWSTGNLPNNINGTNGPAQTAAARRLSEWITLLGDTYYVTAISVGVGSGWGSFVGAIDNVSWSFDGSPAQTFNFELPRGQSVPEPGTLLMAGLALLALRAGRRVHRG